MICSYFGGDRQSNRHGSGLRLFGAGCVALRCGFVDAGCIGAVGIVTRFRCKLYCYCFGVVDRCVLGVSFRF